MEEWLLMQDGLTLYLAIFLALLGGAIGLPIPEDLPLILSGIIINQRQESPWSFLVVCYIGIMLGDIILFSIGRYFGPALFKSRWLKRRISSSRVRSLRLRLERRSFITILVARHLFYLRTVTFLTCGAVRMRFRVFLAADAIAALISAPFMIFIGYMAAQHYEAVTTWMGKAKSFSVVIALLAVFLAWKFLFRGNSVDQLPDLPASEETLLPKRE